MPGCVITRPSYNVAPTATASWQVGTEDSDYPVENGITMDPGVVAKAQETTATFRVTTLSPVVPDIVAIINTNAKNLTVSCSDFMTPQAVEIPQNPDGLTQCAWVDLRGLEGRSATQWDFALSGGSDPVAVGTVVLAAVADGSSESPILEPRLKWDYEIRERFPIISHRTALQTRKVYHLGVRYRLFEAIAHWAEDRDLIRELRRDANGSVTPFLLIPDEDDDDVFLVQFTEQDARERYPWISGSFSDGSAEGIVEQVIEVEEVNAGVAL